MELDASLAAASAAAESWAADICTARFVLGLGSDAGAKDPAWAYRDMRAACLAKDFEAHCAVLEAADDQFLLASDGLITVRHGGEDVPYDSAHEAVRETMRRIRLAILSAEHHATYCAKVLADPELSAELRANAELGTKAELLFLDAPPRELLLANAGELRKRICRERVKLRALPVIADSQRRGPHQAGGQDDRAAEAQPASGASTSRPPGGEIGPLPEQPSAEHCLPKDGVVRWKREAKLRMTPWRLLQCLLTRNGEITFDQLRDAVYGNARSKGRKADGGIHNDITRVNEVLEAVEFPQIIKTKTQHRPRTARKKSGSLKVAWLEHRQA